MYGIQGIDDEEALRQLLGTSPLDTAPQNFQAQQQATPMSGLLGGTGALSQDLQALADSDALAQMAQWAHAGGGGGGTAAGRIAQQQGANQQALSRGGSGLGGLLGSVAMGALTSGISRGIGGLAKKFLKRGV